MNGDSGLSAGSQGGSVPAPVVQRGVALLAWLLRGAGGKHSEGNADRKQGEQRPQQPAKQQQQAKRRLFP